MEQQIVDNQLNVCRQNIKTNVDRNEHVSIEKFYILIAHWAYVAHAI